jgi:hypothetical protein
LKVRPLDRSGVVIVCSHDDVCNLKLLRLSTPIMSGTVWRPEDDPKIRPPLHVGEVYRPDILSVIESSIDGLSEELRALSLNIHGNPPSA